MERQEQMQRDKMERQEETREMQDRLAHMDRLLMQHLGIRPHVPPTPRTPPSPGTERSGPQSDDHPGHLTTEITPSQSGHPHDHRSGHLISPHRRMSEDQRHLLDDHDEFMEQLMPPQRPPPRQEYVQRQLLFSPAPSTLFFSSSTEGAEIRASGFGKQLKYGFIFGRIDGYLKRGLVLGSHGYVGFGGFMLIVQLHLVPRSHSRAGNLKSTRLELPPLTARGAHRVPSQRRGRIFVALKVEEVKMVKEVLLLKSSSSPSSSTTTMTTACGLGAQMIQLASVYKGEAELGRRLTVESVVDVLQLARLCDVHDLYLKCMNLVLREDKAVQWKFLQDNDPYLELEILQFLEETESTDTFEMSPTVNELYLHQHTINHDKVTFIDTRSERFYAKLQRRRQKLT
ncbi:hypothetical protein Syun_001781 [Stephania yunnanensis]|uniref:BTB domain-containing protein n=1 Tax=Stephania yunnanensis TaxID=152371 RepID=A0AAP0LEJ3_9MAGN